MFGFNEFRYTKDRSKKIRYCLMGFLWGLLVVMLAGYVCIMSVGLAAAGMGRLIPAVLVMGVSLVVLFFTIFKAGPVLFDRNAYEKQIALPVNVRSIIVSRFLTMYITDMLLGLLVLLPGMVVYGVMERPGVTFYLYGILAGLFLPLLPLTVASLLGALIAGISSRWRYKNLVSIVLTLVLVCAVLAGSMGMSGMEEGEMDAMLQQVAEMLEMQISRVYPPAVWIADAMVQGSPAKLLLFLAVSLVGFLIFLEILQRFYVPVCMLLGARETRGNYRMKELREKSILGTMVERELRHYFFLRICGQYHNGRTADGAAGGSGSVHGYGCTGGNAGTSRGGQKGAACSDRIPSDHDAADRLFHFHGRKTVVDASDAAGHGKGHGPEQGGGAASGGIAFLSGVGDTAVSGAASGVGRRVKPVGSTCGLYYFRRQGRAGCQ
jgi:hypothetical protein